EQPGARQVQAELDNVASLDDVDALSDESQYYFRRRNAVTNTLGADRPTHPRISDTRLHPGDTLMVMTPGIFHNLTFDEIQNAARSASSADELWTRLRDAAQQRSADTDHERRWDSAMTAAIYMMPLGPEG